MTFRDRQHDPRQRAAAPGGPSGTSRAAVERQEVTERLLARAADAIDRALSSDSDAFLAANLQTGGQ